MVKNKLTMRRKFTKSPLPYKKGFHRHHKIPLFDGGEDVASNMCYLTKEEHIAAHQKRYEQLGLEGDRRAVLILRHSKSDLEELKMWRSENAKRIALLAHEAKLKNGFYKKLGELNSKRLKGKPGDHQHALVEAVAGTMWCNNGKISKRVKTCPEGWRPGRLKVHTPKSLESMGRKLSALKWFTDGVANKRLLDCPPGWRQGRS